MTGQHSSATGDWWSPEKLYEPARSLWGFDLDPFTTPQANRLIEANRIWTPKQNGHKKPWNAATVWVNGPSRKGEHSLWRCWNKAAMEWVEGRAKRVWFVVFNPSSFFQVALDHALQEGLPTPQEAVRVEFVDRIQYLRPCEPGQGEHKNGVWFERGKMPPHGSALLLLPAEAGDAAHVAHAYRNHGKTLVPVEYPRRR